MYDENKNIGDAAFGGAIWAFLFTFLACIGLAIIGFLFFLGFNFGQYNSGTVEASDCRATVNLTAGSWSTYFHKFYCTGGYCTAVDLDSAGKCTTVYYFSQNQ